MTRKPKKFTGRLKKPRPYNPFFMLRDVLDEKLANDKKAPSLETENAEKVIEAELELCEEKVQKECDLDQEMMFDLLRHYGIGLNTSDPATTWHELAFSLALDFVPGFRYEKAPRGRKKKWDDIKNAKLRIAVDNYLKKRPNLNPKDACKYLAKNNMFDVENADSLYQRYLEAKSNPVTLFRRHKRHTNLK